jgi:cytochrome c oxidase subunit I
MASVTLPAGAIPGSPQQTAPRLRVSDFLRWSVDHKVIGVQYMVTSFFFFLIGGTLAMMIRWELLTPELDVAVSGAQYNTLFTMHALVMIFLWIIPMLAGFGNYLIPLMLGAKDMAFPWLNAFAFWLIPPAGILMLISFFVSPPEAGWTMYPPLSVQYSGDGQTLAALGAHLLGISSILGAINFIVTILNMRPAGMSLWQMPLFCWSVLATSIIQVLATPFLAGALTLLLLDRMAGTTFFVPTGGGDPLLWQNIFWFYSHPAVYIMVLPAMGMLSEVLAVHARKPVFGYKLVALSSMGIGIVGFLVWAHHMFTSIQPQLRIPFMITSMIIAVPTGIKIFSWLGTIWGGKIRFTPAMLFALGFLSMFVIGGITGVTLAAIPFDVHVHDTYYVVAHFHFVLYGGSVFGIYAGIYHWWPKITGKEMNARLGHIHFWATYIGFLASFMPMHISGMLGMPRRVAVYLPEFQTLNTITSLGAFVLGLSTFIIIIAAVQSLLAGKKTTANPWRALTLEWATTSPPPATNFINDPVVFPDPYGYGTPEAAAYVAMIEAQFDGKPSSERSIQTGGATPAPAPSVGD